MDVKYERTAQFIPNRNNKCEKGLGPTDQILVRLREVVSVQIKCLYGNVF